MNFNRFPHLLISYNYINSLSITTQFCILLPATYSSLHTTCLLTVALSESRMPCTCDVRLNLKHQLFWEAFVLGALRIKVKVLWICRIYSCFPSRLLTVRFSFQESWYTRCRWRDPGWAMDFDFPHQSVWFRINIYVYLILLCYWPHYM